MVSAGFLRNVPITKYSQLCTNNTTKFSLSALILVAHGNDYDSDYYDNDYGGFKFYN